mgnify:CR=1 FL=1
MYRIIFYEDRNGNSPVRDYTNELATRNDKNSQTKFKSIKYQIQRLEMFGTRNGEPIVKHIDGEIWELRPSRDRILFAAWIGDSFVLLHQFMKDTQKTPRSEIEKARRELADFKERNGENGTRK